MRKQVLKHILFVLLMAIVLISYILFRIYYSGSMYYYVFFFSYLFLILIIINTFYIKKNKGTGFVILIGFLSLLCFFFFPLLMTSSLFISDALGKGFASLCAILVILNITYFIIQIGKKETKIHLVPYTIFLLIAMFVLSLSHMYFYFLMCSQGT